MTGIVVAAVLPGVVCMVTVVGEDVVVGCAVDEPVSFNLAFFTYMNNQYCVFKFVKLLSFE